MRKPGFVINASACSIIPMREICYDKTRPLDFGDNLIIYLVCMLFPIDANCVIAGLADRRLEAVVPRCVHRVVKPHGNEGF